MFTSIQKLLMLVMAYGDIVKAAGLCDMDCA